MENAYESMSAVQILTSPENYYKYQLLGRNVENLTGIIKTLHYIR